MTRPKLHLEGEVAVPYRWSFGRTLTRFFDGTSARRILAARCTRCRKVLVPPTQLCGACWAPTEEPWLEVGPRGVITACTTVYLSFPGQPKEPPYTWATIRLDGADTGFFGIVEEVPHEEVRVGMRVEPVWSEDPQGDLYDIRHFRPTGEPRTLWELVQARAQDHGAKPYLHFGDETWSYARLRDEVARLAGGLRRTGIQRGDVVHVYMNNSPWTLALDLALASLGAVAGPINCLWGADEIAYLLSDSRARAVVVEGCYRPTLEAAVEGLAARPRLIERETPEWGDLLAGVPLASSPASGPDVCSLFYTSGTTGRPKGVPLTHANLLASVAGIRAVLHSDDERGDEVGLIFLPLFHVNALMSLVSALNSGVTVVLRAGFSVSEFADLVERHRVSFFSGVPTVYRILLEVEASLRGRDLSSLRFGVCGAAPLTTDLLRRFEERFGFPIIEGYGLTEGTVASTLNPLHGVRKPGSIGRAIPGQEVAILDEAGRRLAPREVGEICIRGANVMAGYLGRSDADREVFHEGWFRTGDVGYEDEEGYFYIVDRKGDMYIRGGENVYPREVEQAIAGHPAVAESAVIGVPDEVQGEVGRAYVVLREGATLTAEALSDWLSGRLASYKIPEQLECIDRLPKNIIGKVLKKELRRRGPGTP